MSIAARFPILMLVALSLLWRCGPSGDNGVAGSGADEASSEQALRQRARAIHERVMVLDTHIDIDTGNFTADTNYRSELDTQVNLPRMQEGGMDVAWFVVYTDQGPLDDAGYADAYANAMDKFRAIHRLTQEIAPEQIGLAYNPADVRRILAEGRKVAMIGIENAYPMGRDLDNVRVFQEMGGRYMSLTHNGHNQFADSNVGEGHPAHGGLSELGRQAVAEMNRWGIMIDVSHPSTESNLQAIELSQAPVIASHSSARALNDVSRNLTDEELLAIRDNGGVVQAVAFRSYLDTSKYEAHQQALHELHQTIAGEQGLGELPSLEQLGALGEQEQAAYEEKMAQIEPLAEPRMEEEVNAVAPPVDVADLVDHIDYMVELMGIEHVGISADFDGGGGVAGWEDASETFNVTLELLRRGYSEEEIARIWGGNLLRVLDEVQAVAARIQEAE